MAELHEKAEFSKETGMVHVMDAEATVVKSDTAISGHLQQSLSSAVHPLENVPEKQKDWHPNSGDKVLDLLHPSLFSLIYGVSRVLPKENVPLDECLKYSGKGETTDLQNQGNLERYLAFQNTTLKAWGTYQ
jgi:hypothetical protein